MLLSELGKKNTHNLQQRKRERDRRRHTKNIRRLLACTYGSLYLDFLFLPPPTFFFFFFCPPRIDIEFQITCEPKKKKRKERKELGKKEKRLLERGKYTTLLQIREWKMKECK